MNEHNAETRIRELLDSPAITALEYACWCAFLPFMNNKQIEKTADFLEK